MVRIYPFAALIPNTEFISQVACRVGGTIETSEEHKKELEVNPFSYLHVIKPGLHFSGAEDNPDIHYGFARNYFQQMMEQQVISQSDKVAVYIYRQLFEDGHVFEGLITGVSVIDYLEGNIKKHENTLTDKESRMAEHVNRTGVVGEPVLLSNPDEITTKEWIHKNRHGDPVIEFTDSLSVTHTVWAVTDPYAIADIQDHFRQIPSLYIADGHHRIAATSLYLTHMHNEMNWEPSQMCFMAYILPESALWIRPFHRLLKKLGETEVNRLLEESQERFLVSPEKLPVIPHENGEFGVYTRKGWYRFEFRNDGNYHTPAENLDVSRLEKYLFSEILGIHDSKSDSRLSFLRGDMPVKELETLVNSGAADIAFVLFPNSMAEIKAVADAKQTMPPKSTWIEPKMLTGMIIQKF